MSTLDDAPQIDPSTVSPRPVGVRYGLIAALILVAVGLVLHVTGIADYTGQNTAVSWMTNLINWGVMGGAMFLAMKQHREDLGGYMTFGRGFTVGFWVALMVAIVTAIWSFVFFSYIAPDVIDTIMEAQRDQMIDRGMSDADIDQAMSFTAVMMKPGAFAGIAMVTTLILGIIISLIVAAISQRKAPENAGV